LEKSVDPEGGGKPQGKQGQQGQGGEAASAAAKVGQAALPALAAIVEGASAVVLVIVLGAFLVAAPAAYRRGVRALVPREREGVFDEGWDRVGNVLRRWVGGILVSMTLMGTLTGIGLAVAGIDSWLLL